MSSFRLRKKSNPLIFTTFILDITRYVNVVFSKGTRAFLMKFNLFNYTVREYFDEQYEDFKQQKMKGDVIG